jgi:prepilin-type N-terminal cleavage/methylation domain-containing protein/prepilin-type processing-associated H-X9-DG protein
MMNAMRDQRGMTLIELLIVIFIITLLVQLALPAIQMARESANRAKCQSNLHQIGVAMHGHEVAHKHFPAGGWGYLYVGEPDRGVGVKQPGGWIYNLLPYIEQKQLHDMSAGLNGDAKLDAAQQMCSVAIPLFTCPSRRLPRPLPFDYEERPYGNYRPPELCGKSDYAGNAGDLFTKAQNDNEGPPNYEEADRDSAGTKKYWIDTSDVTGVFYQRSATRVVEVSDGLGNTYFVGEKYVDPLRYTKRNTTAGDDQMMYVGADADIVRWAGHYDGRTLVPIQDRGGFEDDEAFGSAHPAGCNFLFGDGSVRLITYDVDGTVHRRQANRRDGKAITARQQ